MRPFALSLLAASSALACAPPAFPQEEAPPRNVLVFIGDGVGTAYWTAARLASAELAVERMPVAGLTDTRNSDGGITDSAAGATVYATGVRTYNGAIGVGPECRDLWAADSTVYRESPTSCAPLESVFDLVRRRGLATGLVATSSVTHATPASFGARVPFRGMEPAIAAQLAAAPIEVILGGGRGFFDGSLRPDSTDLLAELCGEAACLADPGALSAYEPDERRLVGLFAENGMEPAPERWPTLAQMTEAALARLSLDPDGFFLVVEGSQPDWRGHANEPLEAVVAEMLDFDAAIARGLDFATEDGETLVLVVSDHETGGLALLGGPEGGFQAAYSTVSHTGEMTPHFASGPWQERFAGIRENREIGSVLMELARGQGGSAAP